MEALVRGYGAEDTLLVSYFKQYNFIFNNPPGFYSIYDITYNKDNIYDIINIDKARRIIENKVLFLGITYDEKFTEI